MLKIIMAVAVLATTYEIQYAIEALTSILGILSLAFYFLCFRLMTGLNTSTLDKNADLLNMCIIGVLNVTMLLIVYSSAYSAVAVFALPWVVIGLMSTALISLIRLGILDIKND